MSAVTLHFSGNSLHLSVKEMFFHAYYFCVHCLFRNVKVDVPSSLDVVQSLSMTLGQVGHHSKRLMGHGVRMKATPPSFVALTTAWVVQGQRSFVKM